MRSCVVVLFGPPAAGKDTITARLQATDSRFRYFPKLKVGGGRGFGYRVTDERTAAVLRDAGQIVSEVERYGNRYLVDEPYLMRESRTGIPVIHTASSQEYLALLRHPKLDCRGVFVWAGREVTAARLRARNSVDVIARLRVWDETIVDVARSGPAFDAEWDTGFVSPDDSARRIVELVSADPTAPQDSGISEV